MTKLDKAYNYLKEQIEAGVEYPDAEFKASCKFNVDHEKLRELYDNDSQ